jgi:hypothetical protein
VEAVVKVPKLDVEMASRQPDTNLNHKSKIGPGIILEKDMSSGFASKDITLGSLEEDLINSEPMRERIIRIEEHQS